MNTKLELKVAAVRQLAPEIRELCLEAVDGGLLPSFSPGSHLSLELPTGNKPLRNAYSLTSSPFDRSQYRIAVRLQQDSRGGSRYLHREVQAGQVLVADPPSNYFHFEQGAAKLLLIAGGIGVTPFMSLLPCLDFDTAAVDMHFACRSEEEAAYVEELRHAFGERLHVYARGRGSRLAIGPLLDAQPIGTRVYVCGPSRMIEAVRAEAAARGWPDSAVHFEKFAADSGGAPFPVKLKRSNVALGVEAEESLLEAIEKQGIEVPHLCRAGVCGECRTRLLRGEADHRDLFLSEAEKKAGDSIMPCVSRACGDTELVLDL